MSASTLSSNQNNLTVDQEKLIIDNLEYAEGVARQTAIKLPIGEKYGIPMDVNDCIQQGVLGLIQAAQRFDASGFDPKRGTLQTLFRSYAFPRIRGAVIDEVRKQTFVRRRGIEQGISFQMLSMDVELSGEDSDFAFELGKDADYETNLMLQQAIDVLDDREAKIIVGLMTGITGRELAADLGITESRVSQIAQGARAKIKETIT